MLKSIVKLFSRRNKAQTSSLPVVIAREIPRDQHIISRANIAHNALKVLRRLHNNGFTAYLVGGAVRDLLLGNHPKDFDIATNALPEEVKKLFSNCRLIGRRFRLAHIYFGKEIIEVATFRAAHTENDHDSHAHSRGGMLVRDNVFGDIEQDAFRRDFTVNALYYDCKTFKVVDYCGGFNDIQEKKLRLIGEPKVRYLEDPVRMIRLIRFAAKLDFSIEEKSQQVLHEMTPLISKVPAARLFEEFLKLFMAGFSHKALPLLIEHHVFEKIFPETYFCLQGENGSQVLGLLQGLCRNTDERLQKDKPVTPAFLLAVILWYPLLQRMEQIKSSNYFNHVVMQQAINDILKHHSVILAIPRRFQQTMRDVWLAQLKLQGRRRRQVNVLMQHPKLRAAYDFLLLRAEVDAELQSLSDWWTTFIEAVPEDRKGMLQKLTSGSKGKTKNKRKKDNTKKNSATEV